MSDVKRNLAAALAYASKHRWLIFGLGVALLVLVKLWLMDYQLLRAYYAPHDDHHFVKLAYHIVNGEWLGPYSQYTLMKGLFYPLWIALCNTLSIPLLTGERLLYALACVVFVLALRPTIKNLWWLFFIFAFLLFNPLTYDYLSVSRVFRLSIYPALGLLVFACAYGFYTRSVMTGGKPLLWGIGLGLAFAALWHTREESIWILPSLALLLGYALLAHLPWTVAGAKRFAGLLAVPLGIWLAATLSLATLNWSHYGIFTPLEIKSSEFKAAYSGLLRIRSDSWHKHVPVTKEARHKAYDVSPAFRELRDYIEGPKAAQWQGRHGVDLPAYAFIWIFRDAVDWAGYYQGSDAATTLDFYRRMGDELAAACDDGRLDCAPLLSEFMSQWRDEYTRALLPTYWATLKRMVRFDDFLGTQLDGRYSWGPAEAMALFEDVTREPLRTSKPERDAEKPPAQIEREQAKGQLLWRIARGVYQYPGIWLFGLALIALLIALMLDLKSRRLSLMTTFAGALLGAVLSVCLILTLVQLTAYPQVDRAMHTAYPLILAFIIVSLTAAWQSARDFRKSGIA